MVPEKPENTLGNAQCHFRYWMPGCNGQACDCLWNSKQSTAWDTLKSKALSWSLWGCSTCSNHIWRGVSDNEAKASPPAITTTFKQLHQLSQQHLAPRRNLGIHLAEWGVLMVPCFCELGETLCWPPLTPGHTWSASCDPIWLRRLESSFNCFTWRPQSRVGGGSSGRAENKHPRGCAARTPGWVLSDTCASADLPLDSEAWTTWGPEQLLSLVWEGAQELTGFKCSQVLLMNS